MVATRTQTRNQEFDAAIEQVQIDIPSFEDEDGVEYSIEFDHGAAAEEEEFFEDDEASRTTHGSGGIGGTISTPSHYRDGDVVSDEGPPHDYEQDSTVLQDSKLHSINGNPRTIPPVINLDYNDDASDCIDDAESTSVLTSRTNFTRRSTISIRTISKINTRLMKEIAAEYLRRFHIITGIDSGFHYVRLEDFLHEAYSDNFPHGEEHVRMAMGKT